jgi:hypothetical protein
MISAAAAAAVSAASSRAEFAMPQHCVLDRVPSTVA